MQKKQAIEPWRSPSPLGHCICSQLRRAARRLSSFYDTTLAECGLTITQHALLVNIARHGQVSRTALASLLGMDRTTLTRNLQPLERTHLLIPGAAGVDRREKLLRLSPTGLRKLSQSYQRWEKAQENFALEMGAAQLDHLRELLKSAELATEAAAHRSNSPTSAGF
jgi:DNA-binding MarR family transcriptional regulator